MQSGFFNIRHVGPVSVSNERLLFIQFLFFSLVSLSGIMFLWLLVCSFICSLCLWNFSAMPLGFLFLMFYLIFSVSLLFFKYSLASVLSSIFTRGGCLPWLGYNRVNVFSLCRWFLQKVIDSWWVLFADCGTSVLLFFCPISPGASLLSVVLIELHAPDSLSL